MSVFLRVSLEPSSAELLTMFGAGALIRWEYSADNSSWSEGGTEAIVSGTEVYVIEYLAGTSATYLRSRYSKASPSVAADYSGYSDVTQGGAWTAYATITDLTETMDVPTGTGSSARRNLLADLLIKGRERIDSDCFRTFLRVPQVSGTVTVYCDVRYSGYSSLVSAIGHPYTVDGRALDIVSVTSLWYRERETGTYTEIAAGDTGYYLESGYGPGIAGTDWPYEDITLSPSSATRTTFPTGKRAIKIIGALGFPRIPEMVGHANIDKARQDYRSGPGGGAQQRGVNQFGVPIFEDGITGTYKALTRPGSPYVKRSFRAM